MSYPASSSLPGFRLLLLVASSFLCLWTSLAAAVYRETFNYPDGTVLVPSDTIGEFGAGSWRRHDGTGAGNGAWITVNNGSVTYGGANAQDIYLVIGSAGTINYPFPIAASSPGAIYFSFDVRVASVNATGDYFIAIANNAGSVRAGIRAKASGAGFVFGYGGTNTAFDSTERAFNATYRVVLRYNVTAGSANNPGTLYVFPGDLAGVDLLAEANNAPVIAGHVAGTDWDTGIPGPLLNQSANSPVVTLARLTLADNFADALGAAPFTPSVAAPTYSPGAGVYPAPQSVTISSGTAGAAIRYTTDGSNPSPTTGTVYTGPVAVAAATTLKSIAYTDAANKSPVSNASYVIGSLPVANPIFSPAAGNYPVAQSVTITTGTAGSTIRYTTDGSNPTPANGTVYAGPISVASNQTIKAIAYKAGAPDSGIASATYTIGIPPVSAPVFAPAGGFYTIAQSVTLTSATSGATIRYTTDGSEPSATAGTIYTGAISVPTTATVKAIAYKAGVADSLVTSATYNIDNTPVAAPVFSLPEGAYAGMQTLTITTTTGGASIRYTTDGSVPTPTSGIVYSGSVLLASSKTVKAIAYKTGVNDSPVVSAAYAITAPALATYGPDGTHWPANTPKPGSAEIGTIVDVACSWSAIRDAIAAATPAQIEGGLHIRIAPGTLPGFGAGSLSTPVLENLDRAGFTKNILVSPRDGWGTVSIEPGCRINNVRGVTFARINGVFVLLTNCSNTNWAQSRVTLGFRMTALNGVTVTNCNAYEVVMRESRVDTQDAMGYAGGDNSAIINSRWEGMYCAPVFRAVGSDAHVDTMQMYGGGYYRGLTIADSVFWGSQNCALQLGGAVASDPLIGTPFLTLEHSLVMSLAMATQTRYPVLPGGQAPTLAQAINGGGESWQLYASDSLVFGSIYTTKWASVTGSRISYNLAPTNNPAQSGGWQYDAGMTAWSTADFDAVAPMPTDEYLAGIWGESAPVSATVTLSGLQQTYSGAATLVAVETFPAGLAVTVTYDGNVEAPVNAGTYAVVATINDPNYTGSAAGTLVIAPASATIALDELVHVYDGTGKAATVTTDPAGVSTTVTYEGSESAPVNAGNYAVVATIADPNYQGDPVSGIMEIAKAGAGVALSDLTQVFTGTPRAATVTTNPAGLNVFLTYAGSTTAPTAVGSYAVEAVVVEGNYTGGASGTLAITPASATVTLGQLWQNYDGTPRPVAVETDPAGLTVDVTYNGSTTPPTLPGAYAVEATIAGANYSGSASGTLFVEVTALVRHLESLNGDLGGSVQVTSAESVTLNGGAWIEGDLLVPGTPTLLLNGQPSYQGTIDAGGNSSPSHHRITLNGSASLRHVVRRVDAPILPQVSAPPAPVGTRNVILNNASQSAGDFATLRDLTLNSGVGPKPIPPGTYGRFTANGGSSFVLGVPGATVPAVYHFQSLTLNGSSRLVLAGPVTITLAAGGAFNGSVGNAGQSSWLQLKVAAGGVTLNGNVLFDGYVVAPHGTVTINGSSVLTGGVVADRLIINGNGLLLEASH